MTRRRIRSICLVVVATMILWRDAQAATITLDGILTDSTATITDYSLAGDVFTFTLTNTSSVGSLTNLGLNLGNLTDLQSLSASAGTYTVFNDVFTAFPQAIFLLDFGVLATFGTSIVPGASTTFMWTMRLENGNPLSGITAEQIANGIGVRIVGIPDVVNEFVVASPVPEPASLTAIGGGPRRSRRPSVPSTTQQLTT